MSFTRFWDGTRQWHDTFPVMHFSLTNRFLWQVLLQFGVLRSYSGSWWLFWEPLHECGHVRSGGGPGISSLHVLHQQTMVRAQFSLQPERQLYSHMCQMVKQEVPNCMKGFCVKWRNVTQIISLSIGHTGLEGGRACQVFCVCLVLPASVQFWSPITQVTQTPTHVFIQVFVTNLIHLHWHIPTVTVYQSIQFQRLEQVTGNKLVQISSLFIVFRKVLDMDQSHSFCKCNIFEQHENTFTAMLMTLRYVYLRNQRNWNSHSNFRMVSIFLLL